MGGEARSYRVGHRTTTTAEGRAAIPQEPGARTAHAVRALGERLGRAGATPSRPSDQVHSAKGLVDDGTLREWMARERRVVRAVVASGIQLLDLTAVHARYTPGEWDRIAE